MPFTPRSPVGVQRAERCPICDKSITGREAPTNETCAAWRCRRTYREQQRAYHHQKKERFQQQYERRFAQATRVRDTKAETEGVEVPNSYVTVIVPVNRTPLVPLPRKRRSRFAKKLIQLAETALEEPSPEPASGLYSEEEESWALPILGSACAICQGRCCLKGGTHAHLDVATICRYLNQHPAASSRDILAAYCRLLARETYRNSCVFHAAVGCTLPRQMRSATCRNTICSGLIELRNRSTLYGQTRFFISAMDKCEVVRSKFVGCNSQRGAV
jgi:hypothetical protein